jgi:ribosomal-protein-alanine N-acetyltransferase
MSGQCNVDTLITPRLRGERLDDVHRPLMRRIFQNEQVCATLGGTLSDEMVNRALRWNLDHWDRHGFGIWVFFSRKTSGFVGRAGLRRVELAGSLETELAYALMPEFWMQGLATEMSRRILRVGFEDLRLSDVLCYTLTTNLASQNVMRKLGFEFERSGDHADLPHVFYRLTYDEWTAGNNTG